MLQRSTNSHGQTRIVMLIFTPVIVQLWHFKMSSVKKDCYWDVFFYSNMYWVCFYLFHTVKKVDDTKRFYTKLKKTSISETKAYLHMYPPIAFAGVLYKSTSITYCLIHKLKGRVLFQFYWCKGHILYVIIIRHILTSHSILWPEQFMALNQKWKTAPSSGCFGNIYLNWVLRI